MAFLKTIIFIATVLCSSTIYASNWPTPPTLEAKSWALIDARSGQVVVEHNANIELPPASLTKMMTLYLIFEDLKLGRLSEEDHLPVSHKAWKIGGSTMFLEPRMKPKVGDLIHGIATFSGNDACIVMAEHLAGSESAFAERMNSKAKELGMTHSHFINATGFPVENHYSSAMDMAILAASLWRDFPKYYEIFAEKSFTYDGRKQPNRNRLLWSMPEVDGLKTGHTQAAGYCLVASAERDNTRFVSSVFGTKSDRQRAKQSKVLLTHGFRNFVTLRPMERDIRREIDVYGGTSERLWLMPAADVWVTVPKGLEKQLNFRLRYDSPMHAPILKGQEIGSIDAVLGKNTDKAADILVHIPMQAARDVPEASWFGRQWDALRLWWKNRESNKDNGESTP
ncbi:MAG: D-alanyl-D-alanine carboxypeptidase family protein [Mariprofundaceae bacterium]|nr:D-alanyl-D-alanine carboxypeptidase family protein [Mariprofundaceae bacterium]